MKLSIDNYDVFFKDISKHMADLEQNENTTVKKECHNIRVELLRIKEGCEDLLKVGKVLRIGVVGQVKAGKSSFLNSLFFDGETVLPRASTPMTAGLTVIEYGEDNCFAVEYYNKKEWGIFENKAKEFDLLIDEYQKEDPTLTEKDIIQMYNVDQFLVAAKELVGSCKKHVLNCIAENSRVDEQRYSNIKDLQDVLEDYVGADGNYTPIVKCLTIKMCDERLKGVQIVDTPGVNDPIISRELRTREFLRACHGVFFLSYSGRFFDSMDVSFLEERIGNEGIGTVVLIASKFDSVLQDVGIQFKDDLPMAISDCESKLKRQYRSNISNTSYKGGAPIFDFSSGIGYSIASKDKNRWDDMESHIVRQMQMYYPSHFENDEDSMQMFKALSKIDEIQNKYVEHVFVKNKDKIIQEKLSGFFDSNTEVIKRRITLSKDHLREMVNDLEASDINDLKSRKDAYGKMIQDFDDTLVSISMKVEKRCAIVVKNVLNGFELDVVVDVTQEFKNVKRERLLKDKDVVCEYNYINTIKVSHSLKTTSDRQIRQLMGYWKEEVGKIIKYVKDSINECITTCEQKDDAGELNAYALRNILEVQFWTLLDEMMFDKHKIQNEVAKAQDNLIKSLLGASYSPKNVYQLVDDDAVKKKVKEEAEEAINTVIQEKATFVDAVTMCIHNYIKELSERCKSIVGEGRDQFIKRVTDDTQEYFKTLDFDLRDKKNQIQNINVGIKVLEQIDELI